MKYSLSNIKKTIESNFSYRFELVTVLKQPVLKLKHMPEGYEMYIELNKGTKTLLPYVSVVSVDNERNIVNRSNELFDINKILFLLNQKLIILNINYISSERPLVYKQDKLIF